jgi:parallel beta-helix repeat protein
MAVFSVTNLNPAGVGSFREAIIQSNRAAGADTIDFAVSGTIRNCRSPFPAITDAVTIDGTTAPGFSSAPVVTVDFRGAGGLKFAGGSDGSILRSLSVVNAGGAGVDLLASRITLEGNYIGLRADGKTAAGNRGDGVRIASSSHGNLIGRSDPVTGVDFHAASGVAIQPVSAWQGIRATSSPDDFLITGTSGDAGLLYAGPITGVGGISHAVNYPNATATSVYGPDVLDDGVVRLVGSYKDGLGVVNGFLYEGTTARLSQAANYRTIDYPGAKYTYVHSTMGGLAVGNADGPEGDAPLGTGHAFLYDVARDAITTDIVYPGSITTTAYGIWSDGRTGYTITGGYTDGAPGEPISHGYLVDYDAATGLFSHWKSFDYPNGAIGRDFITHFEGISGAEKGVYTLVADSVQVGASNPVQGSFVSVRRETDGSFGDAAWVDLDDPAVPGVVSANSVAGYQVVGIVAGASGVSSYQATVDVGFQRSNVIAGNGGNGIGVYGSHDNQIAMNYIGTDATGTLRRGNGGNGVLVTGGSSRNRIGGQATGGNDPTAGVFVRPPQGNLISGNRGNGVLITRGATRNVLSGNFVGTTASGNSALGNRLDGVAIVDADGNQLIGCTFQQDPFVFYNVLGGNGGNGLRITNSDDTTVQANFMGVGANNASVVANGGDGLLISGSSRNTQVGGVIPLGNVISGNRRNGIEVRDAASGFISFNTFAGVFAFGAAAPNGRDGILITSRGGDNVIRTSIVSGNLGNGITLGGHATGVQVTETAIGANTSIQTAIPNGRSGILITGRAHGNAIGGFQPSIEPQVTISANRRYGIEVAGSAHDNTIFHTDIGTNSSGSADLGNQLGGIDLGPGTSSTTIGGLTATRAVKILYSGGDGVSIRSSRRNAVLGSEIANSQGYGVSARGDDAGTVLAGNTITSNARGDVDLSKSRGVTYTA